MELTWSPRSMDLSRIGVLLDMAGNPWKIPSDGSRHVLAVSQTARQHDRSHGRIWWDLNRRPSISAIFTVRADSVGILLCFRAASAGSLVDQRHVISKVYFPRLVLPISATLSGLVDLGVSMVVFLVVMAFYRIPLGLEILALPGLILVTVAFALAIGLWLATLSAKYQDVSFAIAFLVQALMYASPVIYPVAWFLKQLDPFIN